MAGLSGLLLGNDRAQFAEAANCRYKSLGLTLNALAERCKMSPQRLSAILKKNGRPIRIRTAVQLSIVLDMSVPEELAASFWRETGAVIGPRLPVSGRNLAESNLNLAYHLEAAKLIPPGRVEDCAAEMSRYYRRNVLALLSGLLLDLKVLGLCDPPIEFLRKLCQSWKVSYADLVGFRERKHDPWTREELERLAAISKAHAEQSRRARAAKR